MRKRCFVFAVFTVAMLLLIPIMQAKAADRKERFIDLCEEYEDKFKEHSSNYKLDLPWGAEHIKFQLQRESPEYQYLEVKGKLFLLNLENNAVISINGWGAYLFMVVSTNGIDFLAENTADGTTEGSLFWLKSMENYPVSIKVEKQSPNAGMFRSTMSSLLDFNAKFNDVDSGAFVIIEMKNGSKTFFKTDCSECANILIRFLNKYIRKMNEYIKE